MANSDDGTRKSSRPPPRSQPLLPRPTTPQSVVEIPKAIVVSGADKFGVSRRDPTDLVEDGTTYSVRSKAKDLIGQRKDKLIAFIDHPLGEADDHQMHTQNMENAGKWARWVFLQTPFVVLIPWWPMAVFITESAYQPRVLGDQLLIIRKVINVLVQCGGFVSPHMRQHEEHARRFGVSVAALTQYAVPGPYGPLPPEQGERNYHRAIGELSKAMDHSRPT